MITVQQIHANSFVSKHITFIHDNIYIYIYICVCVCVCELKTFIISTFNTVSNVKTHPGKTAKVLFIWHENSFGTFGLRTQLGESSFDNIYNSYIHISSHALSLSLLIVNPHTTKINYLLSFNYSTLYITDQQPPTILHIAWVHAFIILLHVFLF